MMNESVSVSGRGEEGASGKVVRHREGYTEGGRGEGGKRRGQRERETTSLLSIEMSMQTHC